jgi:hypothetical protein
MTTTLLVIGAFVLGYVAGAIRIAKRLNPLVNPEVCETFVPHHEESSVETLKRVSETLQTHAASMRGVTK